jgi:hypothetical protein
MTEFLRRSITFPITHRPTSDMHLSRLTGHMALAIHSWYTFVTASHVKAVSVEVKDTFFDARRKFKPRYIHVGWYCTTNGLFNTLDMKAVPFRCAFHIAAVIALFTPAAWSTSKGLTTVVHALEALMIEREPSAFMRHEL